MNLRRVCQDAYRVITQIDGTYQLDEYVPLDGKMREALTKSESVKTDIYVNPAIPLDDCIRLSVVLSDFTSLFFPSSTSAVAIGVPDVKDTDQKEYTRSVQEIELPELLFQSGQPLAQVSHDRVRARVEKNYFLPLSVGIDVLMNDLGSLMESGRLLIRPTPQLKVFLPERKEIQPIWLNLEPNTPGESWIVQDKIPQTAIPLKQKAAEENLESTLGTLVLPYLSGIKFGILSRVLDDEEDYLGELRVALKQLLAKVPAEGQRAQDLFDETILPATQRVHRRFRSLAQMHSLKVAGATFATVTVSLASLLSQGIIAAIGTFLSTAGVVGVTKELADYWKAMADAKELPFYLLWRFDQERRR